MREFTYDIEVTLPSVSNLRSIKYLLVSVGINKNFSNNQKYFVREHTDEYFMNLPSHDV